MSHAVMIAVHAAQAATRDRTRVLDAFRIAGATAPDRARPLAELALHTDDRAISALLRAGVIRGVDARGRPTVLGDAFARTRAFYLDEAAVIAGRSGGLGDPRRKVILAITVAIAALAAGLIALLVAAAKSFHYVG